MTLAELQAHVDQRSANLTKKKWKVAVGPTQERGFRIDGQKRPARRCGRCWRGRG